MKSFSSSVYILTIAAALLALASCGKHIVGPQVSPHPVAPIVVWTGSSGGYAIRWTTGEITATPEHAAASHPSFSELGRAIVHFTDITRKETSNCDFEREAVLQSVVGSIVSVRENDTMHCENGSNGVAVSAAAVSLANPKKAVTLRDFFTAGALAEAMTKASRFCKTVPKDLSNRFAFDQLRGDTVVIVLTLKPDCSQREVNLALPVPASLQQSLRLAAKKREGFLRRDQAAIAHGAVTTIRYHYRTAAGS